VRFERCHILYKRLVSLKINHAQSLMLDSPFDDRNEKLTAPL
jgi:hypothetical protein